jgi:TolB-like protein
MAVVFLAHEVRSGRTVALKALRPELAGVITVERFLRETRLAETLKHPGIVPLLDAGEADGLPWYAMPYFRGSTLRERIAREQQLPIREVVQIASEIAEALDYAHSRDIVHRDIKPDNILFEGGRAVVADFGIARAIVNAAPVERLTASGITVGTPPYSSPEQSSGEERLDSRSDVYSLGCVVYEMLAGVPPFTGPTASAIRARHQLDPVPSLRTVRSAVPAGLEQVIVKALAKVPADRYATAGEFAAELKRPPEVSQKNPRNRARLYAWTTAAAVVVAGAFATRDLVRRAPPVLEPNRIMVYPLVELGATASAGIGYDVALMIGNALERTDPLRWLDGWAYLDQQARADVSLLTAREARRTARERGAGYYIDGVVRSSPDSVAVTLRLFDVTGDSVVARRTETASASASATYGLALSSITNLLPRLLGTGQSIDFSTLSERRPAAIALWLQGEREYRQARFGPALALFERSVGEDSSLAFAAVRGAQAANWLQYGTRARRLLEVARARETHLIARHRDFANGLDAFLAGQADSAVTFLERARAAAPDWIEAAVALGDVYYHLLPQKTPRDSIARAAFEAAESRDSLFAPALLHLAEMALRDRDIRRARRLMDRLRAGAADTAEVRIRSLMVSCVENGAARFDWSAARGNTVAMLFAARGLAVAASHPECAAAGFESVLGLPEASPGQRWSALMGLQGVLAAQGRVGDVVALLDSAVASGTTQAMWLYALDAEAGLPVHKKSADLEAMARQRFGEAYAGASPYVLWMMALHHARVGDIARVSALQREIEKRVTEPGARTARLLADAVAAHLALARRDTVAALTRLRSLHSTATPDSLTWSLWEPLAAERMKLARLLVAHGDFAEAIRVASAFDHPQSIALLPFVPASLEIRQAASQALGDRANAAQYRRRLEGLGNRSAGAAP